MLIILSIAWLQLTLQDLKLNKLPLSLPNAVFTPVSYTHLDVYKRQVICWIIYNQIFTIEMKRSFYAALLATCLTLSHSAYSFQEDAKVNEAIRLALSEKWYDAFEAAKHSSDPKFSESAVQAIKIYNSPASIDIASVKKFFESNRWIPVEAYAGKIERSISFEQNSEHLIEWFKFYPPTTNQGKFLSLHAELNKNVKNLSDPKTKEQLRKIWRTTEFDSSSEEYYIKKYKEHFTVEDLLRKIEHLTWRRSFDMSEKLIAILPKKYQTDCLTRLKIARNPDRRCV